MILLGRITGAHGIRGEVAVHSYAATPEDIAAYGPLSDQAGKRSFMLKVVRVTPKGAVIARIAGVSDRNAAEALKGTDLYIARERLPAASEGEYYYADLIGLPVVRPDGRSLGEVVSVQNFGAGDLLEIRLLGARDTELVPFTDRFVPAVEIAARRVVVDLPVPAPDDDDEGEGIDEGAGPKT